MNSTDLADWIRFLDRASYTLKDEDRSKRDRLDKATELVDEVRKKIEASWLDAVRREAT